MIRFLVVDDDPSTVSGLSNLLKGDGHHVSPFTSGADAIVALSRDPFDAVITDLEMPHTDGHAVVRTTRERLPHACVVVATARAPQKHRELADAGACMVSDKPIDYEAITRAVAECRGRGGPGAHGQCHLRSEASPLLPLSRR